MYMQIIFTYFVLDITYPFIPMTLSGIAIYSQYKGSDINGRATQLGSNWQVYCRRDFDGIMQIYGCPPTAKDVKCEAGTQESNFCVQDLWSPAGLHLFMISFVPKSSRKLLNLQLSLIMASKSKISIQPKLWRNTINLFSSFLSE